MSKKINTKKLAMYFAIVVAMSFATLNANAQIIWDQGSLTFTKTTPGQSDNISGYTHLTRGSNGPLYNAVYESSQVYGSCSYNPTNTEWAYGNISDWNTLTYQDLFCLNNRYPPSMVNRPMVVHLIQENIYLQLTFTYWQATGGGNFTYTRTTTGCGSSSLTNVTICQGQSYTFNGVSYNTAGTYKKTLTNAAGCDSIATLNLSLTSPPDVIQPNNQVVCRGASISPIAFSSNSTGVVCGTANEGGSVLLTAPAGTVFTGVDFASYGNPNGTCGNFTVGSCHATNSASIVAGMALGQSSVSISANNSVFGDPCVGTSKRLYVALRYASTVEFNWTNDNTTIGLSASGNGNIAGFTGSNNTSAPITSSITVTPSIGYCVGTPATFTITVNNASRSLTNLTINSSQLPYTWNGLTFTAAGIQTKGGLTNALGCDSSASLNLSVNSALSISGANSVCVGSTITMSASSPGGVWSISGRGTINSSGVVTGTSAGATTVKYTLGGISATKSITVYALPAIPSIAYQPGTTGVTGTGGVCKNKTFTLLGTPAGGSWSSTGVISITNSGVVTTTNALGACSVTYTYTNANACKSSRTISNTIINCGSKGANQTTLANEQFVVYPNPAHSVINLNIKTLTGKGTVVLTDLYGKQLKQQPLSIGANSIDVSNLAKGTYLMSVTTEQGKQTQKIVVE